MRTTCFLNLPPPPSASLIPTKPPQVSLVKNEGCWRRQCVVVGVASYWTIIGLEMCHSVTLPHANVVTGQEVSNYNNSSISGGGAKWSQKRTCPSWHGNSLETIVPENLPRPAARRRYEAVGSTSMTAPPLSAPIEFPSQKGGCFSM